MLFDERPRTRRPSLVWLIVAAILIAIPSFPALSRWRQAARQRADAEDMVNMLMIFDRNGDGKLSRNEVPERMQGLFDRGDSNRDGILTPDELRFLAEAEIRSRAATEPRGRRPGPFD